MDLDADYYPDTRILEILEWYEELLQDANEDFLLEGNVLFGTRQLMDDLGGWLPLPANEETELRHRALNHDVLRFCPFDVLGTNYGVEKSLLEGAQRFRDNSRAKIQLGVNPLYLLGHWLLHAPGIKPRLGALLLIPLAYYEAATSDIEVPATYARFDPYVLDFRASLYQRHPELWLDPPQHLTQYIDEAELARLQGAE